MCKKSKEISWKKKGVGSWEESRELSRGEWRSGKRRASQSNNKTKDNWGEKWGKKISYDRNGGKTASWGGFIITATGEKKGLKSHYDGRRERLWWTGGGQTTIYLRDVRTHPGNLQWRWKEERGNDRLIKKSKTPAIHLFESISCRICKEKKNARFFRS